MKETLYKRKPTNGLQAISKALTSFRKHRGEATPSPSWVLFEADEATTTFRKAPSPKARANLYRKRTSHAEVCKLSHDSLSLFRFFGHKEMKGKDEETLPTPTPLPRGDNVLL